MIPTEPPTPIITCDLPDGVRITLAHYGERWTFAAADLDAGHYIERREFPDRAAAAEYFCKWIRSA